MIFRKTLTFLLLWAAVSLPEGSFTSLFNGKDFDGWESDTPGVWRVQEGMIVGRSPGLKHNDFLRTRKSYSDFQLRLTFQLVDGLGNSGVQFRSKPVPGSHEVSGYQADIAEGYWACLYDESRRNRVLARPAAEKLATLDTDGWNEYVITARGRRITIDLNGVRAVDYVEEERDILAEGIIALQVHSGPPMEVRFKEVLIRELKD